MKKNNKLTPINGHVILQLLEEEAQERMHGNIVLPDMIGDTTPDIAKVIAVDRVYNFNTDTVVDCPIKKGMKVVIPKMGMQKITLDNETYLITSINQIIAIVN
jgi:co-chaperonin GroES (HSP10)